MGKYPVKTMNLRMLLLLLVKIKRRLLRCVSGWWGRWCLFASGVDYGVDLRIYSAPVIIRNMDSSIVLGNSVAILNSSFENPAGIAHRTVLAAPGRGAKIVIGNNVGISGAVICAHRQITIKNNVLIGVGARIYDTDFHPIDKMNRRANDQESVCVAPVMIEEDVWIGAYAFILKGVTIGAGAIVAAGAVVVHNVEPNTVVGGSPARELKLLSPPEYW